MAFSASTRLLKSRCKLIASSLNEQNDVSAAEICSQEGCAGVPWVLVRVCFPTECNISTFMNVNWLSDGTEIKLLDAVGNFRLKLH